MVDVAAVTVEATVDEAADTAVETDAVAAVTAAAETEDIKFV
jgi:hypothetical protein